MNIEAAVTNYYDKTITAQCVTSPSVPAAQVTWSSSLGDSGQMQVSSVVHSVQGGQRTVSTVYLAPVGPGRHSLLLQCDVVYDDNIVLTQTHVVDILSK